MDALLQLVEPLIHNEYLVELHSIVTLNIQTQVLLELLCELTKRSFDVLATHFDGEFVISSCQSTTILRQIHDVFLDNPLEDLQGLSNLKTAIQVRPSTHLLNMHQCYRLILAQLLKSICILDDLHVSSLRILLLFKVPCDYQRLLRVVKGGLHILKYFHRYDMISLGDIDSISCLCSQPGFFHFERVKLAKYLLFLSLQENDLFVQVSEHFRIGQTALFAGTCLSTAFRTRCSVVLLVSYSHVA